MQYIEDGEAKTIDYEVENILPGATTGVVRDYTISGIPINHPIIVFMVLNLRLGHAVQKVYVLLPKGTTNWKPP